MGEDSPKFGSQMQKLLHKLVCQILGLGWCCIFESSNYVSSGRIEVPSSQASGQVLAILTPNRISQRIFAKS